MISTKIKGGQVYGNFKRGKTIPPKPCVYTPAMLSLIVNFSSRCS